MIEGLFITDIETKCFVRVNSSLCRMLGYSEEELLAASIKDIHPPEEVSNDMREIPGSSRRPSLDQRKPPSSQEGWQRLLCGHHGPSDYLQGAALLACPFP